MASQSYESDKQLHIPFIAWTGIPVPLCIPEKQSWSQAAMQLQYFYIKHSSSQWIKQVQDKVSETMLSCGNFTVNTAFQESASAVILRNSGCPNPEGEFNTIVFPPIREIAASIDFQKERSGAMHFQDNRAFSFWKQSPRSWLLFTSKPSYIKSHFKVVNTSDCGPTARWI